MYFVDYPVCSTQNDRVGQLIATDTAYNRHFSILEEFTGRCPTGKRLDIIWQKSLILKSSQKYHFHTPNTVFGVLRISPIFAELTHFPRDVSEMHTTFHSTDLKLILHSGFVEHKL